jgi:glutamate-1-semialdehyde 2,1-aminomutase
MLDESPTNSGIISHYRARTAASAALAARARESLPSGIVHDSRHLDPYPIYVNRAAGSRKWDVDGNEYVDYYGGHGALLLGHNDRRVIEAAHRQLDLGTHYAACHELELRWAELVKQLVPCAERVRFTSSGTEANLMALRLARAYTGKTMLVRFNGHFHGWQDHVAFGHGWQDHVAFGYDGHFDGSPTPGVLPGIAENVLIASPDDLDATLALLGSRDDIAAVILEPTGASFGWSPMSRDSCSYSTRWSPDFGCRPVGRRSTMASRRISPAWRRSSPAGSRGAPWWGGRTFSICWTSSRPSAAAARRSSIRAPSTLTP